MRRTDFTSPLNYCKPKFIYLPSYWVFAKFLDVWYNTPKHIFIDHLDLKMVKDVPSFNIQSRLTHEI